MNLECRTLCVAALTAAVLASGCSSDEKAQVLQQKAAPESAVNDDQAAGASADGTAKAVFVIVDGIPADVIEAIDTPTLDAIAGDRGYTRSWVGGIVGEESESPTVSAVGYNHLLTGTWSNKHNVWTNSIEAPNYAYWDIFRIAKNHDPSLQTAVYSTWLDNRTRLIGDGLLQAGGKKIDYAWDGFEHDEEQFPHDALHTYIRNIDAHVASGAAQHIEAEGPDLSWVYLQYTDDVGHGLGDSPLQIVAIKYMDELLGGIWAAVETREAQFGEDWLVIVTTDHGRDAETGKDHGGQTERERTTWIVTNSDGLNARFKANPPIVDILPSIATHLKLSIPADIEEQLDGRSFID